MKGSTDYAARAMADPHEIIQKKFKDTFGIDPKDGWASMAAYMNWLEKAFYEFDAHMDMDIKENHVDQLAETYLKTISYSGVLSKDVCQGYKDGFKDGFKALRNPEYWSALFNSLKKSHENNKQRSTKTADRGYYH